MHRAFIRLLAATSIVITGIGIAAAPARANDNDAANALAALLGLAIVGAVIHNKNKDDDHVSRHQTHTNHHKPKHHNKHGHTSHKQKHNAHKHGHNNRHQNTYNHRPRHSSHVLPGHCMRSWRTHDGRMRVFSQRCLQRNYGDTAVLPDRCYRRARTQNGTRHGFAVRCLSRHGYQFANS